LPLTRNSRFARISTSPRKERGEVEREPRSQAAISYDVFSRFIVLTAVNLNDDKSFTADEIADVVADRFLPHKFVSANLPIANTIPENRFRVGLIDA